MSWLANKTFGFMGCGNMAQTIIKGWLKSESVSAKQIYATNRSQQKLEKFAEETGINPLDGTEQLLEKCDVIILAMKPQDLPDALDAYTHMIDTEQIIISLAAGVPLDKLKKIVGPKGRLIRVMPNTPAKIGQGVIGYCLTSLSRDLGPMIEDLFTPLGVVIETEEGESFEALTVSAASGVGFVFELMQYWQEWLEEHDFNSETARLMTVKTFLGAALLADQDEDVPLSELLAKVTSKKGVTAAGLSSMRELELERGLRYSFEKAVLRDRELSK